MPAHLAIAVPPTREPAVAPQGYLPIDGLCGGDAAMRQLIAHGKRFIDRGLPILILGETGTGKEYLARALHAYSERRARALVAINCASIPEHLIESELFGYCRGAFSGALPGGMKGKIPQADGGTLFLDEIGDMPCALQTRLLRVLSEKEVTPLGSATPVPVDTQLICATHQDLPSLVAQGRFREDLYYRIAVGVLRLPALRERTDRLELLQRMVHQELPALAHRDITRLVAADALAWLTRYRWPGNLRQMKAAIRHACAVMNSEQIRLDDLPADLLARPEGATVVTFPSAAAPVHVGVPDTAPPQGEREKILSALADHRWNISAAARALGLCRASLYRKLKHWRIPHVRDCASEWVSGMPGMAGMALAPA